MSDLRDAFGAAGFQAVRTYIQSGNVLFEAEALREHRQPLTTLHSEEPHNDSRGRGFETSAHPCETSPGLSIPGG